MGQFSMQCNQISDLSRVPKGFNLMYSLRFIRSQSVFASLCKDLLMLTFKNYCSLSEKL
jgi:hypothetical protein